ncbi:MAG TPA: hypothetical protein VK966_11415, partial [Longimicrobiales bacterium]|nr:hypothetical protein [Longimicrobiales bacterium]
FRFPAGVQPVAFEEDRVLAVARDSLDLQRLVAVPLPGATPPDTRTADGAVGDRTTSNGSERGENDEEARDS